MLITSPPMQVPGAKEEWGVAGGGEMGSVTEVENERQMQQDAPDEVTASSASNPGLAVPAPTHEVCIPGDASRLDVR
jgi:hypothetical protein